MSDHRAAFAALLASGRTQSLPGVWDGLSLHLVEAAGFPAAFLSGGALSIAKLGRPDIGLATVTELADTLLQLRERTDLPLFVDIDTGFGNALNAARTMRQVEQAGASAVQIEDQLFPKRCGHMTGKAVIPTAEMVDKLKAVLDARRQGTLVSARTDAVAVEGFDAALDRARAYAEAGADLIFVEGPRTVEEMQAIRVALPQPLVHNLLEGAVTPVTSAAQLQDLGFAVALHPLLLLHGFVARAPRWLGVLRETGSTDALRDEIAELRTINALLGADELTASGRL